MLNSVKTSSRLPNFLIFLVKKLSRFADLKVKGIKFRENDQNKQKTRTFLPAKFCFLNVQWNLSKADTYGIEVFFRFRKVSALERLELKSSQICGTAVLHWTHFHTDSSSPLFDYGNVEW